MAGPDDFIDGLRDRLDRIRPFREPRIPKQGTNLSISDIEEGISSFNSDLESLRRKYGDLDRMNPSLRMALDTELRELEQRRSEILDSTRVASELNVSTANNVRSVPLDTNPLNDYINVTYTISLTMIPLPVVKNYLSSYERKVQLEKYFSTGNMKKVTNGGQLPVTMASTGGKFDDRIGDFHSSESHGAGYYNIKDCTIKNVFDVTNTNPIVSTLTELKMTIVEPVGFRFYEDIFTLSRKLGYQGVHPARAVYRIGVRFSGFREDTGEWVEEIDLTGKGDTYWATYAVMTNMEANVSTTGTTYTVDFAPFSHYAYRPEEIVFDSFTIPSGATFGEFLENLSEALRNAKAQRTDNKILREYVFNAPKFLLESPFESDGLLSNSNVFLSTPDNPDHIIVSGKGNDLITILRGALENTLVAQELFIAEEGNDSFLRPRIMFTVRFDVEYGSVDNELNDFKEMRLVYNIEPYITFKNASVRSDNADLITRPEVQRERIRKMLSYGMVKRVYDYLFTGKNTEVISMDTRLKSFFFFPLKQSVINTSDLVDTPRSANETTFLAGNNYYQLNEPDTSERILTFGMGVTNSDRRGIDRLGGSFNDVPSDNYFSDASTPPNQRRERYVHYMRDYLSNDLLQLDSLVVRGDPYWLLTSYTNPAPVLTVNLMASNGGETEVNLSQTGSIIFVRMYPPDQADYMNPEQERASSYSMVMGGFYQVVEVISSFEGGKFTQTIKGVKMVHLNYAEEAMAEAIS